MDDQGFSGRRGPADGAAIVGSKQYCEILSIGAHNINSLPAYCQKYPKIVAKFSGTSPAAQSTATRDIQDDLMKSGEGLGQ